MNSIHRIFKNGIAIERINLIRATINEAQEIKDNLLDDVDCKKVIIDLCSCDYIDSTFFGAMVFAYRILKRQGCTVVLVISQSFISKSFIYQEISSVFKVYLSMTEAVEALNDNIEYVEERNKKNVRMDKPANIVQLHLQLNSDK